MTPIICATCGEPITGPDYDARHWGSDGEEYHAGCCPECKEDEEDYAKATTTQ